MNRSLSKTSRWWMMALMAMLALVLTSCGKKSTLTNNYGWSKCVGTMGELDVYTVPSKADPTRYEVFVIPIKLTAAGDVATATVVNQQSLAYKELVNQVVLFDQQEIFLGYLSKGELSTYDVIGITSYQAGVSFLQANPARSAFCSLPIPKQQN